MQAIADHAYHILIIAFVATTIVQAVVTIMSKPRNKKRGLRVKKCVRNRGFSRIDL